MLRAVAPGGSSPQGRSHMNSPTGAYPVAGHTVLCWSTAPVALRLCHPYTGPGGDPVPTRHSDGSSRQWWRESRPGLPESTERRPRHMDVAAAELIGRLDDSAMSPVFTNA